MKRNILKYTIVMFLAISLFSCDDFDQDINYYDSVKLDLSATKFTVLDSELPTTIDFMSESKVVSNVEVLKDGNVLYSGTAADNKFTFTLLRSDLGLNEAGDSQRIYVNATVDGKVKELYTTISMTGASSIATPVDADDEDDSLYELSDLVKNFTYEVSPKTATVGNVTASVKVGMEGTYAELWSKTYDDNDLDIGLVASDYVKGDTVFVKLVAEVGSFSETVETSVIIEEYLIGSSTEISIDAMDAGYDLVGDSIIDVTETACTIEFTNDFAQLFQGFNTLNTTGLVMVTGDMAEEMNMPILKATYDAGMPVDVVENVTVGAKYIIKTTRDSKDYYGTLEILSVNEDRIEAHDFVSFSYVIEEYNTDK